MLYSYLQKKAIIYFQKTIQEHMQKEPRSNTSVFAQIASVGGLFFLAIFLICQYDSIGQPGILTLLFILYCIALYLYFQIIWYVEHIFFDSLHSLFYQRYYKKYGQVSHQELLEKIDKELYIKKFEDEKDNLDRLIQFPKDKKEGQVRKVKKI